MGRKMFLHRVLHSISKGPHIVKLVCYITAGQQRLIRLGGSESSLAISKATRMAYRKLPKGCDMFMETVTISKQPEQFQVIR